MPESVGHHRILERIGAGAMGEVYRARDTSLGRTVAVRVVAPDIVSEPGRRERFVRDARAAAALSHPNIAALYEVGEDRGQHYLVCEFVPSETLTAAIGGRPLNPRRAIDLAIQLADAVADAHARGIVHGDLKPGNVIVTPKGAAKILDFGLAAWTRGLAVRERAAEAAAGSGPLYGEMVDRTLPYMSPEQAMGAQCDSRTDIFSLGVMLFEMLTGRVPFVGATPSAVAAEIARTHVRPPSAVNRAVPAELDPIVQKMLARSPDQRYASAATAAAELRSVAALIDARSDVSEPPPIARVEPAGASKAGWVVVLAILAALVALVWLAARG